MTVQELIAELRKFDLKTNVVVEDMYGYGFDTASGLKYDNIIDGEFVEGGEKEGERVVVIRVVS